MEKSIYRYLLWELIAAMDTGITISIDDVSRYAENGKSSALMMDRLNTTCDFSLIKTPDWAEIDRRFASLNNAVDAKRKFGIEKSGICLLMAYTLQCLQESDR